MTVVEATWRDVGRALVCFETNSHGGPADGGESGGSLGEK
jgi:hypothetical protein